MSDLKTLCIQGNKNGIENMYNSNSRCISSRIYSLMLSPQPEIFRLDNISFISYIINKEELFSRLTSMNMRYIFKTSNVEQIRQILDSYPLISMSIKYNPMNIILDRLDDISLIELCCELSKNIETWLPISNLKIDDDKKLEIYTQYKDVCILPKDSNIISKCTNLELFKIYIDNVDNNIKKSVYDLILVTHNTHEFLDIVCDYNTIESREYGRINNVELIPTMNINMLKYFYTIRTPKKYIFEETIGRVLLYNRLDMFELLLQLAPKDIDIWLIIQRNPSVNIVSTYLKYFKFKQWQWNYLEETIAVDDLVKIRGKSTCNIM